MKHRLIPKQWNTFTHIKVDEKIRQSIPRLFAICTLFKDSDYTASNDWMPVKTELETMWKEAAVVYFKVLYRNLPVETEGCRCPSRD
jgi:hypothetical protein